MLLLVGYLVMDIVGCEGLVDIVMVVFVEFGVWYVMCVGGENCLLVVDLVFDVVGSL